MALTRSMLNGMGLTADQISAIIEAHTESTDALKAQRDEYKAKAAEIDSLKAENEKLKTAGTSEEWQQKFNKEHEAFENFKADIKTKEERAAKAENYKALLKECGVSEKRFDTILKVTDLDGIKMKDGKFDDEAREAVKKDWADFIETTNTTGAQTQTPPPGTAGAAKAAVPTIF